MERKLLFAGFGVAAFVAFRLLRRNSSPLRRETEQQEKVSGQIEKPYSGLTQPAPLLKCIQSRRSVFPRAYSTDAPAVSKEVMSRLIEAAMWAPFHGPIPPWRFVVLGQSGITELKNVTLGYYDKHWEELGQWSNEEDYLDWKSKKIEKMAKSDPASYLVAIIMKRQAGSKRMPEWEEAAATACAVQNMHLQASAQEGLACYWSSWQAEARDSEEMKAFLKMEDEEDKCLGFFFVAAYDPKQAASRSRQPEKHMSVEWRE